MEVILKKADEYLAEPPAPKAKEMQKSQRMLSQSQQTSLRFSLLVICLVKKIRLEKAEKILEKAKSLKHTAREPEKDDERNPGALPCSASPGRFDEKIYVPPPDFEARKKTFELNLKGKPLSEGVDFSTLAELEEGYSGADISLYV